ncbi:UDP-N-acetylenolpyruvoylglucosamine reductase [Paenibacillus baekrokdamisoli]|uniref:UDP-N-acetylenolpyruvoylglucosamine reductase n=1 Tax=Paenibacillus baekrokdamisoli TaxID=1712516 RepID=A0A3G9IQS8_9BACL|nr:UDP-N-acetylmuramate dehydrogenase [Paenibacillus baekrokdamisoli]MBB3070215.1 UDP-N-acetylmuramate dehydrogenase [Paenibacillus baekrokdamisoli]BBH21220.1 UDP-N-acetylenolpyruvoylglucosamine reductase [Paenibacillus baekrokdamisoli]
MKAFLAELKQTDAGNVMLGRSLSEYTTWKIGGPADVLIIPQTKDQLISVVKLLHKHEMQWMNLGRGSNMLVSDKGIRGVVIQPGDEFDCARFDGTLVTAGAAFSLIKLSVLSGREGLTGLEFAGGIPGSVGGAVYMNAGALGSDVSRIFKSADIVLETGELVSYGIEEMGFSYRHSILHERPGIVVSVTLELEQGDRKSILATMAANKERRLLTQPLQMASAGSVFRNPPKDFAARLIQEAGLKGMRHGGAEVSTQHANFIVNTGQATAEDVLTLMATIRSTIKEQFGVELVPEVLVVGER